MIRMRDEEFELAKRDLDSLIQWSGEMSVADEGKESPMRLPIEQKSTCEKCPFYTGKSGCALLLVRSSAQHD